MTSVLTPVADQTRRPWVRVFDDVLPRPDAYRAWALAQDFRTLETAPGEQWQGIAVLADPTLPDLVAARLAGAVTSLTFLRQSPAGQREPYFIHTDAGMGQWTAILYLTPDPPAADGTTFWRHRETDAYHAVDTVGDASPEWDAWQHVAARFNRLLLFEASALHSRAIAENYGVGNAARLIQVAFGVGR